MNFMQWLNSLDELLYEVVSWIVFFPVTLWKTIRHPLAMLHYSDRELGDPVESQYTETLSPPIFLVLALVLAHALEVALVGGNNPIVQSRHGLAGLITDDTTLLLLRVVLFSVFPLIAATRMVRRRTARLDRKTLKRPFYAQCFATGPFALGVSLGGTLAQMHVPWVSEIGLTIVALTFIGYGTVQTLWFAGHLDESRLRGFADASIVITLSLATAMIISVIFIL